jgi:hypothetical protein
MSNTLTVEKAESLVRLMTDGLVNIVDKTGEFLLKRESLSQTFSNADKTSRRWDCHRYKGMARMGVDAWYRTDRSSTCKPVYITKDLPDM